MQIQRVFTRGGVSPYAGIEFAPRSSQLTRRDSSVVFSQDNVMVPVNWDQTSVDILAQKYFRRKGCNFTHPNTLYSSPYAEAIRLGDPDIRARMDSLREGETDVRETIHRIVGCWTSWGERLGYFDSENAQAFYDEMSYMMATQMFAPNSPQFFNTGLAYAYGIEGDAQGHYFTDYGGHSETKPVTRKSTDAYTHPATGACFIQSVQDDLVGPCGIMDLWTREARIFKFGGGSGTNFSRIRGSREPLSGGGVSSGLISFLRVGDRAAGAIKSGGTSRRAAKLVCLDLDHPDIEEFIGWKVHEERKVAMLVAGSRAMRHAWDQLLAASPDGADPKSNPSFAKALREARRAGVPDGFLLEAVTRLQHGDTEIPLHDLTLDWEGEAYDTVSAQNANNSVRIPDTFMIQVASGGSWDLTRRVDGKVVKTVDAKSMWGQIAQAAWTVADPGIQFDTTYNFWHTCPEDGRINSTNPCQPAIAPVLTPAGIRTMGSLKVGDAVWSGSRWTTVVRKVATGTKTVFRYHTQAGTFIGTSQHRVMSEGVRVEAADACLIDTCHGVATAGPLDNLQDVVDGLMLGDGSCVHANDGHNTYMVLTIGALDSVYFDTEVAPLITAHPYDMKGTGISRHRVATTLLPEELPATYDRSVPDRFFYGSELVVRAFLRGLYSANGSICGGRVTLKAASFQVIDRVQQMLSSIGIPSYYTTNKAREVEFSNGAYQCRESYDLNITHGRFAFQRLIGFLHPDKNARLAEACLKPVGNNMKTSFEVTRTEEMGEMPVWDIEVASNEHTYWTGGLLVSNCSEYAFLDDTTCNLGSLNLVRFLGRVFDLNKFTHGCQLMTVALDITVSMSQYPSEKLAENADRYRTLGGGYANLGGLLMRTGVPYDSDEGRDVAARLTAHMTGVAYHTSAQLAAELGPFPAFSKNCESTLRVLRMHALLANGDEVSLPGSSVHYQPIRGDVPELTRDIWSSAVALAETWGVRNAQVTVLAPTGTIGILMGCDTTGVEPDFALVKFKKLSGGGYMKLVNQGVPYALRRLGYAESRIEDLIDHVLGEPIMKGHTDGISKSMLLSSGYSEAELQAWDTNLRSSFDPSLVLPVDALRSKFGDAAVDAFLADVGGAGSMECAGHLGFKDEHLPVFDCASRCGRTGTRFISPEGHLKMMAAIQPFLSGSISKTVNVPNTTTVEQIADLYFQSWSMGIKSVAIYRDGSKMSQPLATSMDLLEVAETIQDPVPTPEAKVAVVAEQLARHAIRRKLPPRRAGYTQAAKIGGSKFYLRTGEYEDGSLGEIFLDAYKEGTGYKALLNAFAIAISIGLQHGVPLEEFCDAYLFTKFEPNGLVQDHDAIKMCLSVLDFVFRDLAINYLRRFELANVKPEDLISSSGPGKLTSSTVHQAQMFKVADEMVSMKDLAFHMDDTLDSVMERALKAKTQAETDRVSAQFQGYTGDACPGCGHLTLVRNGTCNKCVTCGSTTGCS